MPWKKKAQVLCKRGVIVWILAVVLLSFGATNVCAQGIFEDFEDGVLDPRISIVANGSFISPPGIKDTADFGSTKAFGFGKSACGASCFSDYMTTLKIEFSGPTYVGTLSFKEMEVSGNWGSGGKIFIDGEPLTGGSISDPVSHDFGRFPYNDGVADTTYRLRKFEIQSKVTVVELKVWDITSGSEIVIDDLAIDTCVLPPDNLLSWWRGQDNADDSAGTSHGVLMNGATFAAGKVGRAFSLDGVDDYIEMAESAVGDFGGEPFTIEFWMYSHTDGESAYVMGKSFPDGGQGWDIRLHDRKLRLEGTDGWHPQFNWESNGSLAPNVWNHIAISGATGSISVYVNGSLDGTTSRSAIGSSSNPFRIGFTTGYGGTPFNGLIDEVSVYNRALSAEEIAALYSAGSAGKCAVQMMVVQPGPGKNDGTDDGFCDAGKDAYFYSCSGDWSGSADYIFGHPRSTCNECNAKAYVQFNISSLPTDVEHVYLGVTHYPHTSYCYSNCSADFYFYPVLEDWNEMSPPLYSPAEASPMYGPINISFPNDFGQKEYDITDTYRLWKSNALANNGFVIYSPNYGCNNAAVGFVIASSDHPDTAKRPYLKVISSGPTYKLRFASAGSGTGVVASCPTGLSCDTDCAKLYPQGTVVTLTATPDAGSGFAGWSGDCRGIGKCAVEMNGDRTVTATFKIPTFSDVPGDHPFFGYIEAVYNDGIAGGFLDGTYKPSLSVSRQAMAAFIIRALEGEPPADYCDSGSPFTDVPKTSQFCKYIKRMYELGITTGCTPDAYCPFNPVSRQAMAAFIIRAIEGEPPADYCSTGSPFTDVPIDSQFCRYVKRFSELKITKGCTPTEFCRFNNVTRAAMAAFLARAFLGIE